MNDYLSRFTVEKNIEKALGIAPSLPSKGTNDGNDGAALSNILENLHQKAEFQNCPTCAKQLSSSGAYHFWCEACHYDLQEIIPANERVNYCRFCHDPLTNGACDACQETHGYKTHGH